MRHSSNRHWSQPSPTVEKHWRFWEQSLDRLGNYLKEHQSKEKYMDQKRHSSVTEPRTKEFVISRSFDVPRELMFKVWTDPAHMQRWWGPKGVTVINSKMDLRPGGIYHYGMRTLDGHEMWGKFVFREIVKPERLVFVNSFSDEKGGLTRHPMSPNWPLEMLSTITFTEQGGKTTVTVRWAPLNATAEECKTFEDGFDSMQQGWGGTLDQLSEYLSKVG